MKIALYIAAFLTIVIGGVHSYLGERFILVRLFRKGNLPKLFGGTEFTARTLRFAWHLTSVAWCGFAAILISMAHPPLSVNIVGLVIGCTFLIHFLIALVVSRGKHLSWPIFLVIGVISILATRT